ncbi:Protein MON2-like protein [Wallemia ichthyophaga EXF-994]|uniref:Protein MON2-like protein n=1 Tax=Wallemia ichthyophaga (strain EXF-994 / CBS 113033) TaxID=1299270 RepID=R9ACT6_WALI9|nr:Protein MON2-like protein [Wallemia ichthyophaga EXF-994]EOQ99904.1 Protein MON2-like protein [Wallemia ichthyophaga EXF-994]
MWLQSLSCLTSISDHLQTKLKSDDNSDAYLKLWIDLLRQLKDLGLDDKQEVRLGTISTLFQSLDFYGHSLSLQSWEEIIWTVIIPLLDKSLSSHWQESLILALESTANVFKNYLHSKIKHLDSFNRFWSNLSDILTEMFKTAESKSVSLALKSFITILEVSEKGEVSRDVYQVGWSTSQTCLSIIKSTEAVYAQESLELLLKFIKCLYQSQGSYWDDDRCVEYIKSIDFVLKYTNHSKIRADFDILTPLQNQSLKNLSTVEKHNASITSIVLDTMSRWSMLAYNKEAVHNARVSFVALSKQTMAKFAPFVKENCMLNQTVISSGSLNHSIKALGTPMSIKYLCPPASKRDDSTLWEIAQDHYCNYVQVVLDMLQQQKNSIRDEDHASILTSMVNIMSDNCKVDRRLAMNEKIELQARWERHEVKLINNFKQTLLPQLGDKRIPLALTEELIETLCNATYPYLNPEDYNYGSLIEEITSPVERLSYYIFDVLFQISQEKLGPADLVGVVQRYVVARCITSFERYCCDRNMRGPFPLSRCRRYEIVYILNSVYSLLLSQKLDKTLVSQLKLAMAKLLAVIHNDPFNPRINTQPSSIFNIESKQLSHNIHQLALNCLSNT